MNIKPKYPINVATAALIVVDAQLAFGNVVSVPNVEAAVYQMRLAISTWLVRGGKVFLTQHVYKDESEVGTVSDFIPPIYSVLRPESEHAKLYDGIQYVETTAVVRKTEFNAFHGTTLEKQIRKFGMPTVVVCGLTTPICVEGTVRGAVERGFKVVVLSDACASQAMGEETAEQAHCAAIGRMGYVFAQTMTTAEFIASR